MNNFEEYSQPTFEILEKPMKEVLAILYNTYQHANVFSSNHDNYGVKHLIGLENIFNVIDKEQFMTDTTLQPVIDFNDNTAEMPMNETNEDGTVKPLFVAWQSNNKTGGKKQ